MLVCAGLLAAPQLPATAVYNWSSGFANGTAVPDNNPSGWADSRTVTGLSGSIQSLSVSLDLAGGWNGDLYAYLQHGSGYTTLLNRVGTPGNSGYGNAGSAFNVLFSGTGTGGLHSYLANGTDPLTGTWQPDGAGFSTFTGLDPNGTWNLFVADLSSGDVMTVNNWGVSIDLSPVPESNAWAALSVALLGVVYVVQQRRAMAVKP